MQGEGALSFLTQQIAGPERKVAPAATLCSKAVPCVRKQRPLGLRTEPSAKESWGGRLEKTVLKVKVLGVWLHRGLRTHTSVHSVPKVRETFCFLKSGNFHLTGTVCRLWGRTLVLACLSPLSFSDFSERT